MSERDSVHKEIEKFQEEIKEKNKKLAAQDGRHKHHEDEVNRVSLNQDLNFKLGISTDLTKFRALDKESVNKVERLQECRQLRPLKVLRVALIYVILSTYLSQHKHHKDEVNRVSLHQNLNFKLGI